MMIVNKFKKKVLIYTKDPRGGVGTFVKNLYKLLIDNNYIVLVIYHNNLFNDKIKQKKIGYAIEKQNKISVKNLWFNLLNFAEVTNIIKSFKPNYIYSIDLYANLVAIILQKIFFRNIKLIANTQINIKKHIIFNRNIYFSTLISFLVKKLYPLAKIHITPSKELSKNLVLFIDNQHFKIKTIPLLINKKEIIARSKWKKINNKYTLTTFSRLNEQKNVELLIESITSINLKHNKKITLQIIGNGELKEQLKNKHKLDKYVKFLGWHNNPYPFLTNAKIFILISNYEGFPYSLLEALTLGKPIIASNVDYGPREIILDNKYGLLTKNSIKDISNAILKMLKDKNLLHYRNQSIKRIKYFDQVRFKNKYLSLFH